MTDEYKGERDVPLATPQEKLKELQEKEKELSKFLENLENNNKLQDKKSPEYHLNRLINETFLNPYDILEIAPESNEAEIK